MAGDASRYDAGPQPANRRPAPPQLALVQAFLNTHFDATAGGEETLETPRALDEWLVQRGLIDRGHRADADDLARILSVREGLRALGFANNGEPLDRRAVAAMHDAARGATTAVRIEPDGPEFLPVDAGDVSAVIGVLLAGVARAMIDGSWARLKACPGRHCGWAFYDHSRNQSARWCAMKVCGDREKARAYYRRRMEG
jgi:predicted RNA-binding Zn ribbon-like protein